MALNFDPTKKVKKITTDTKIFESPKEEFKEIPEKNLKNSLNISLNETVNVPEKNLKNSLNINDEEKAIPHITLKNSLNETVNVPHKFLKNSLKIKVREITGQQRQIVMFIYNQIIKNPDRKTNEISTNDFIELLNKDKSEKSQESVRHNILALIKKGCLKKEGYKSGPGGYSQYSMPEDLIIQISQIPEKSPTNSLNNSLNNSLKHDHSKKEIRFKELNNTYIQENFPNIQKIGFRENHLNKTTRPEEEILEILTHYEHSLQMNEVKVPAKLPVLISIISDSNKTWISESYLSQLNTELQANERRVEALNQIRKQQAEEKLRERYEEYISQNPDFKKEVLQNQPMKNLSEEILEKISYEEFKRKCL